MPSGKERPEVIDDYLQTSGESGGPIPTSPLPRHLHNRFGAIPKGLSGKWMLIVDTYPEGGSVSESLCFLTCVGIRDAVGGKGHVDG